MRVLLSICLFSICFSAFSQKVDEIKIVDKVSINIFHNPHDLAKLRKHPLKRIYIKRVITFMELLPFLSHNMSGESTEKQLEVPMNKKRKKLLEKHEKTRKKFYANLKKTLDHTVNYADKEDIIKRIVLIDNAIGDMFTHIQEKK